MEEKMLRGKGLGNNVSPFHYFTILPFHLNVVRIMEEEMLRRGETILQSNVFPFYYLTISPFHALKR
jgi:hypothetical protein